MLFELHTKVQRNEKMKEKHKVLNKSGWYLIHSKSVKYLQTTEKVDHLFLQWFAQALAQRSNT